MSEYSRNVENTETIEPMCSSEYNNIPDVVRAHLTDSEADLSSVLSNIEFMIKKRQNKIKQLTDIVEDEQKIIAKLINAKQLLTGVSTNLKSINSSQSQSKLKKFNPREQINHLSKILIAGEACKGKTTLIKDLIQYIECEYIYYFSPITTQYIDNKGNKACSTTYTRDVLRDIIQQQSIDPKLQKHERILVIVDDYDSGTYESCDDRINWIIDNGRHADITLIMSVQDIRGKIKPKIDHFNTLFLTDKLFQSFTGLEKITVKENDSYCSNYGNKMGHFRVLKPIHNITKHSYDMFEYIAPFITSTTIAYSNKYVIENTLDKI